MTKTPPFSVIIPAHNEEAVIGRVLDGIFRDAPQGNPPEVIVAANGCSDGTVSQAREAAPLATVIDLSVGSKTSAINAANRIAKAYPRIVLDADVECSYGTLAALAEVLEQPDVMIAAPQLSLDLSRCNRLTTAYYRAWQEQPYAKQGRGGAGCYGLSREGLMRIGEFPDIIADDIWVHTRFPDEQRRLVTHDVDGNPARTIVHPPRTAREQIKVEARRQIGNRQVRAGYDSPHMVQSGGSNGFLSAISGPAKLTDVIAFFTIKFCARLLAKWNLATGRQHVWVRDQGSRIVSAPRKGPRP